MPGRRTVWKDPKLDNWIRKNGPKFKWHGPTMYREAIKEFPDVASKIVSQFTSFMHFIQQGGGASIIFVDTPTVEEHELQVPWKTVLVTADYQIPYHDSDLVQFAFDLGAAWQVEAHVINADFFDMATISKFPQQIFGERVQLGEELSYGKDITKESKRLHKNLVFNTGNHEWRLIVKLLHGELESEQVRNLLYGEGVMYTPLSYLWLGYKEEPVRITHPRSQSVIVGTVGADISRNYDCHVIVAHDHLVAQRRSHSGRWTVTHSGMMAKPEKLLYAVTADDRRPRMNQGFVIVHPDHKTGQPRIRLIDAKNCDRELELWIAERKGVHNNGMEKRRKTARSK